MSRWIIEGLRTPKPTTGYPDQHETAAGVSPGMPSSATLHDAQAINAAVSMCPTAALERRGDVLACSEDRCVHCFRCRRGDEPVTDWSFGYQRARTASATGSARLDLAGAFRRSLHVLVVDAGACGACMHEIALLSGPHYNMHRLGFFVTPTPRRADVLLVSGPVTDHMREPLDEAFSSMPEPRRVVAVGACALSGGVFGPSFACGKGAADVVPVDVVVPGCPPPPLSVLHALLLVAGRTLPADDKPVAEERRG